MITWVRWCLAVTLAATVVAALPTAAPAADPVIVGAALGGRVVDVATHDPVAGLVVVVHPVGHTAGQPQSARTDRDGRYLVDRLYPGSYVVEIRGDHDHDGQWWPSASTPTSARRVEVEGGEVRRDLDDSVGPIGVLRGRLVDEGGQPLAGVEMRIYGASASGAPSERVTDADGRYEVPAPATGPIAVFTEGTSDRPRRWLTSADGLSSRRNLVVPRGGVREVVHVLPRSGTLEGVLTIAETGAPAPGVAVTAESITRWGERSLVDLTDATGHFVIPGVPAGPRRIYLGGSAETLAREWTPAGTVRPGETTTVAVRADGAVILTGRVVDADGNPVADERVYTNKARDATTDDDGRYTIEGMEPGDITVAFRGAPGLANQWWPGVGTAAAATPIRMEPGDRRHLTTTLQPAATISGSVGASDGPLKGPSSVAAYVGDEVLSTAEVDADGRYTLTRLPAGSYDLVATDGIHPQTWLGNSFVRRDGRSVGVRAGEAATGADIRLRPGSTLRGTVRTADGRFAHRTIDVRSVDALDPAGDTVSARSDRSWSLGGLRPGRYAVTAQCDNGRRRSRPVTVTLGPATTRQVRIVLRSGEGVECVPEIVSAQSPRIDGTAKVGHTLRIRPWQPRPTRVLVTYSWWAGNRRLASSGTSLTVPRVARGERIEVRARATRPGYRTLVVRSARTVVVR